MRTTSLNPHASTPLCSSLSEILTNQCSCTWNLSEPMLAAASLHCTEITKKFRQQQKRSFGPQHLILHATLICTKQSTRNRNMHHHFNRFVFIWNIKPDKHACMHMPFNDHFPAESKLARWSWFSCRLHIPFQIYCLRTIKTFRILPNTIPSSLPQMSFCLIRRRAIINIFHFSCTKQETNKTTSNLKCIFHSQNFCKLKPQSTCEAMQNVDMYTFISFQNQVSSLQ